MSLICHDTDDFLLMTAATAQWHDIEWLRKHLPADNSLTVTDVTEDFCCHLLTGPRSREILAAVCDADLTKGWLTHQKTEIGGSPVELFRVSYAGELGWEVHTRTADTASVAATIHDSGQPMGLRPFGMYALNALRLEKGYRTWKGDLSTDYTVLQGGLNRFINWDKPEFIGKAALLKEAENGPSKQFVTLLVDATDHDAPYMSTIWLGDRVVGETTSGGWGYRIDASVALGVVSVDCAKPGTELEVEIFGSRRRAVVQADAPLWDPENKHLRA
jgi:dimethylglycine dehydrogenase